MDTKQLSEKHNWLHEIIFRIKSSLLMGKRFFKNLFLPTKRFKDDKKLPQEQVIAFSESELWNVFDNQDNWVLTAGKVQNLRIASKKIHGIEVKKNEVFSFWKHIGNPNFGKGYVKGREIREGCIVPTIAGGLCQLSNALYDAALKANFTIVERHKHTKVIAGSLAEKNRDATVKWNYLDLRFKSNFDFRIEVELTSNNLTVSFKSKEKDVNTAVPNAVHKPFSALNDCYSCGNSTCFKHPNKKNIKESAPITTFVLDERWIEFDNYLQSIAQPIDNFILPLQKNRFIKTDRYAWAVSNPQKTNITWTQGIYRALKLRFQSKKQNNIFELSLKLDKNIALAASKRIPIESTHLVVAQNLLPFLFEVGALGGRTFDVLMTRLPIEKLHDRLNFAYSKYPNSATLHDFRASKYLIDIENHALTNARKIITVHTEIAEIFKNKAIKLEWFLPKVDVKQAKGSKILFPASAIARKGAHEVKRLAQELEIGLVVWGKTLEQDGFWESLKIEKFTGDFNEIALIVYPTYIEHQPRQLLKALSNKIPIITTTACGLESSENVKVIEIGNFDELKKEVCKYLKK